MKIAFCDFETTGLPAWQQPSDHVCQPWIVSQSVIKRNDFDEIAQHYTLVTAGAESDPEALDAHGLTHAFLAENGQPAAEAIQDFVSLISDVDLFVSHNVHFDRRIARIAIKRFLGIDQAEAFKNTPYFCTMQAYKQMKGLKKFDKGGSLDAACQGMEIPELKPRAGKHHALDDTKRCMALFDALVMVGHGPAGYHPIAA